MPGERITKTVGGVMGPNTRNVLSAKDYFFLSFGFIIGVGWVVASGGWIESAGPLGATGAFLIAGLLLIPVGLCYAELGGQFPVNGGVIFYAYRAFGRDAAFLMATLFLLSFVAALAFFTISVAWVFEVLAPSFKGAVLYSLHGADITLGAAGIAVLATIIFGFSTYISASASARVQELVTYSMLVLALLLVGVATFAGAPDNLSPLVDSINGSSWRGVGTVLIVAPFFLSGFEAIAQSFGEKDDSVTARKIGFLISVAILSAVVFYGAVIFAAAYIVERDILVNAELPLEAAFRVGAGSALLGKVVLVAALFGLFTSWNACIFATARVFTVLGQMRFIAPIFAANNNRPVSLLAVVVPSVLGLVGVFAGQKMLAPVLNASSLAIGLIYFAVCICLVSLRGQIEGRNRIGAGVVGAIYPIIASILTFLLAAYIIYEPLTWTDSGLPIEWISFLSVLVVALIYWLAMRQKGRELSKDELESLIKRG